MREAHEEDWVGLSSLMRKLTFSKGEGGPKAH